MNQCCANGGWERHRFAQPALCMWRKCCSGWCGNNYLNTIHVSLHLKPFDGTLGVKFHNSIAVMILTFHFSRFHHFVVLNFTKSGSQLCTVQQDPTVRLQGRDCAADCRCEALPQTIKQLHSPNLEQVHLDSWTHRRVTDSLLSRISMTRSIDAVTWWIY